MGKEHSACFRFYEELNDFLPLHRRKRDSQYRFNGHPGIKDSIEAQGVPHTEVDLIVVNGESVGFGYQLMPEDRVAVYPMFESLDITPVVKLREAPLRHPAFILDVHLGKLARILRLLGFDTLYRNDNDDPTLAGITARDNRILLTCDRRLLMRKQIVYGYLVRSRKPQQQIQEVLNRFKLFQYQSAVARCLRCNGIIRAVSKQVVEARLLPLTKKHYDEFFQCDSCNKIYWEGSHYSKIQTLIERFKNSANVS